MLTDGEAEDVGLAGELEAVAERLSCVCVKRKRTYMAVLCDRTVFSSSSNSWKSVGFSTLRVPISCKHTQSTKVGAQTLTTAIELPSSNDGCEGYGIRQPIPFNYRDSDQQQR